MFSESRLLIAELVSESMTLGVSERELVQILTGAPGSIETLRDEHRVTVIIETRMRRLLEMIKLLRDLCGDKSERWLQTPNSVLGLRTPLQALLQIPASLEGFLALMRIYHADNPGVTIH